MLAYFSSSDDGGLEVLPTHRAVPWEKPKFVSLEKWGKLEPVSGLGALKKLMAKALLKDSYLTYRMTFPTAVLKANAPNIEAGTHAVEWQFSVGDAVKAPLVMTAEIQKPPFLKWLLAAGIAILIFGGAFFLWRRRR